MLIKTLTVGHLDTNCYVVTNEQTKECVVIDPGAEGNTVMDYIEHNGLSCRAILLTHGHFDHTGAVDAVREETGATVYMTRADDTRFADAPHHLRYALPEDGKYYDDLDTVTVAGLTFDVIGTPGHTRGGVTLRCGDALFTGDTLFHGTCGRSDLPGGNPLQLAASLRKLCALEGSYDVYPGHMESTTLDRERASNPYCITAMNKK